MNSPKQKRPKSFREVIALWVSPAELAADCGVTIARVRKWQQRDSIAPTHWLAVVMAAARRGYPVSLEDLARMAASVSEKATA